MNPAQVTIDGLGPLPVVSPTTPEAVGELVRAARAADEALYPLGGSTSLALGLPPTRPGQAISLRHLTQVIDYPARDMTITVQAGITLQQLADLLAREQQRLPIDVPLGAAATLGGAMAANISGPRRYGHGTLRDYVIGITVVNDEGHQAKAGGRVVKNVAGYDLCKLHVGALGTLGIITQVTLKLRPLPEEHALLVLSCPEDRLGFLLDLVQQSPIQPVCIEVLNPAASTQLNLTSAVDLPTSDWCVIVGLEGNRTAVSWQVQQLLCEVKAEFTLDARVDVTATPLWTALVEFPGWQESSLTFKASVLPSQCAALCQRLAALPQQPLLQAHAGNGIIRGHLPAGLGQQDAATVVAAARQLVPAGEGWVVVERCAPAWKAAIPVWNHAEETLWLMKDVKNKMDPKNIFNPGRYLGGI